MLSLLLSLLSTSTLLSSRGVRAADASASSSDASAPVKVWLRSSWAAPALLLEIIETVAIENPDNYYLALDALTSPEFSTKPLTTDAEVYEESLTQLTLAGVFSEPGSRESFDALLSLHAATPLIDALYQYYGDVVAPSADFTGGCGSWVAWGEDITCDSKELQLLASHILASAEEETRPSLSSRVYPFDHIYPSPTYQLSTPAQTAILYISLDKGGYRELYDVLLATSNLPEQQLQFVVRYVPPTVPSTARNYLAGYGVAMDLKKTDYLALDDRKSSSSSKVSDNDTDGDVDEILDTDDDVITEFFASFPEIANMTEYATPLVEEEFLGLTSKAAWMIGASEKPLTLLRQLSQNFPKYATALAKRVADPPEEFLQETTTLRMSLPQGFSGFWINGQLIPDTEINPLTLIRTLRAERKRILALETLGLTPAEAISVIAAPPAAAVAPGTTALDGYFDASDRSEEGGVIVWWNDIEKDSRYASWSPAIANLLRGSYYGQAPNVRRNLHNIITVLDLSLPGSLAFITGPVPTIISRNLPLRWGMAPIVESEMARKTARLFYYSVDRFGRAKTINLFKELADQTRVSVDLIKARSLYDELEEAHLDANPEAVTLSFDVVINSAFEENIEKAASYATRLSVTSASSPTGHGFINGKHFEFTEEFLRHVQAEMGVQTQFLVEQIYTGKLQDSDETPVDMSVYFYDLPSTAKRRNPYIYPSTQTRPGAVGVKVVNLPEGFERAGIPRSSLDYIYPAGREQTPLTIWVVGDLDDPQHAELLRQAVIAMAADDSYRLGYIHIPASEDTLLPSTSTSLASESLYALTSQHALANASAEDLLSVLNRISPNLKDRTAEHNTQAVLEEESPLHALLTPAAIQANRSTYGTYVQSTRLLKKILGLTGPSLIVNGRVIGPIDNNGIIAADFATLCGYELDKRVSSVVSSLNATLSGFEELERHAASELITMVSSVVSSASFVDPSELGLFRTAPEPRNRLYETFVGNYSTFFVGDLDNSLFQVGVIMNPLSEVAQKWSSILTWLSTVASVHITVVLNPHPSQGLPLKRFYRYSLPPTLGFNAAGAQDDVSLSFYGLPADPIYTLGMDVSQTWLVRPRESPYDLDNIHLATIPEDERAKGVTAVFDLDFLVIEGHARESTTAPPRGVQLQLTNINSTVPIADTLVMANVGYLQFRAKPGVFQLSIRPGRGREVYDMESVGNEGWNSPTVHEAGDVVTLTSFEGLTLYPRLKRKAGMEQAEVLEESSGGIKESVIAPVLSWVKSYFPGGETKEVSTNVQAEINIFTVASGLLYERFVGIMILSVLRNTNSSVKFWFIENFLSPSFLEFIPHLAEAYGFQYELVTYKWPSWLRAQTEKQRIIWAYKILFLDVLFPMDLKRVIFVDADQIVRADLKELVDLDLQGAPYGYTPMGDDNTEMEGFRFWKTGYWKDFLRGRPYHISALYVIDLVRFRQLAAGDKLRGQYHGLSADPNSLANLDQDLPNNLQHDVPIFSLPEDWLWCETWCSKDRLDRAKTIDLCQNPLTKEPKLSRARQIPEWEEYDGEIARFAQSLVEQGKIKSGAAAASVNELASIGSKKEDKADEVPVAEVPTGDTKHNAGEL